MEHLVPEGGLILLFACEQVVCQFLQSLGRVGLVQVHGDPAQKQGVFTEFFHFKAQLIQKFAICQQFGSAVGAQAAGQGSKEGLGRNGFLIGFQFIKEDPLVGGVFIDEECFIALFHDDIAVVQFTYHSPVLYFRHGDGSLLHFRLFQILCVIARRLLAGRRGNLLRFFGNFRGLPRQCAHWLAMTRFFGRFRYCGYHNGFPQGTDSGALHLGHHGGSGRGLGLGGVLHGCGEVSELLCGHGAEERLRLPFEGSCLRSRLRGGSSRFGGDRHTSLRTGSR